MKNTYKIQVDFKRSVINKVPIVTKNDTISFEVSVFDDGKVVNFDNSYTFALFSTRDDDKVIAKEGKFLGVNKILFDLGTSETQVVGNVKSVIQIYGSNSRISSFPFSFKVVDDPSIDYAESSVEATLLQSIINNASTTINYAKTQGDYAKTQGDYAKTQGDYAKTQGNFANEKGLYAQQQGDYAKAQGDYAKAQGDYPREQGDYAKTQGNFANEKGLYAKTQGDYAKTQGDYAKTQGNFANEKGLYAQQQGDYAKTQGDYAKTQGNFANEKGLYAQQQGDYAKAQGDYTRSVISDVQNVIDNMKYLGSYDNTKTYYKNNVVEYNGSSYIAKTTTNGNTPVGDSNDVYWGILAKRGLDGSGSIVSVNNKIPDERGNVTVTASDVGASPTGHTHAFADITSKPTTLGGYGITDAIPNSQKGAANGVATLDGNTKVPTSQLPSASTSAAGIVQLNDTVTSTSTTQAATANAVKQVKDAVAAHSAEIASKFTNINLNIIDMAVELETLKGATLNGVIANIFIETFTNLNDINLMNGVYDRVNKRLVL